MDLLKNRDMFIAVVPLKSQGIRRHRKVTNKDDDLIPIHLFHIFRQFQ